MNASTYSARCVLALGALALAGCAEELGPEPMKTVRVTGRVTLDGKPVGPGWLEFQPIDGTVGRLTSARLDRSGTFRADRVPEGRVAMRLAGIPPIRTGNGEVDMAVALMRQRYLIHRSTGAAPAAHWDINLNDESVKIGAEALAGALR